jgi:hypothetical protein
LADYYYQKEEADTDPYTMFVYAIRSPYTKESSDNYVFFLILLIWVELQRLKNAASHKATDDPSWAFSEIIRFLHCQKERVERKEITAGTLHNYVKTIKMFCEVTDVSISWKKEQVLSFLNTRIKDRQVDPEKRWMRTWNDYLENKKLHALAL